MKVDHISGVLNTAADALFRNSPHVFQQCVPSVHNQPSPFPMAVSDVNGGEARLALFCLEEHGSFCLSRGVV